MENASNALKALNLEQIQPYARPSALLPPLQPPLSLLEMSLKNKLLEL